MSKKTPSKPKAYSYLRFSTPEQSKGDSFRRQATMARDYCEKHNLTLDESVSYRDLGVSAYRGKNAETGKLGDFLEAVRQGLIAPGSFLLVESLDRISRDKARKAMRVLEMICEEGIVVVTLMDNKTYTVEDLDNDPATLLISLVTFIRANEESETKSRRLKSSWENKRDKATDGPITARGPAWLRLDHASNTFQVIEDRARVVRNIFDWTVKGIGQTSIAKRLNESGVPVFGRGKHWHRTYISKILQNRAVIGTFTPHVIEYVDGKKRRKPKESIANYFPAIVAPEIFFRVQNSMDGSNSSKRGRHAKKPIQNLFGTIARCPKCGGTMTRVNKGSRSTPKLVCTTAKSGAGCEYHSVSYVEAEEAFLRTLPMILDNIPAPKAEDSLDNQIEECEVAVDHMRERVENLVDELSVESSPAIRDQLRKLESELEREEEIQSELLGRREAANGQLILNQASRLKVAIKEHPEDKEQLNGLIRQTFRSIVINYVDGDLDLYWPNGAVASVPLASYDFQ